MARMRPPIVPDQPVPVVPEDGPRRLLAVCAGKDFEARRDTAIVMFLLDTGAHRGELADLQLTDLDLDLDVALVLGKGRRERALPYGRKTAGTAPRGERRTVTLSRTLIASVCRPRGGDRDRGRRTPSKTGSRTARRR
jgi:integrase